MNKVFTLILLAAAAHAGAQTHTEKINKELDFAKPGPARTVIIANINGNVKVEGYTGDKVLVEVTRTITGKTPERLEKGKKEVQLGVIDLADTLIFYVEGVCNSFANTTQGKNNKNRGWHYSWNDCDKNCREEYSYRLDFTVRIPAAANLDARTVNDGDITVTHVQGTVVANNVNGHIRMEDLTREAEARTINGNVDIEYTRNPTAYCSFYTLNGDINAFFRKGLAANLGFESFNGEFYTNIDKLEPLPAEIEKKSGNEGIKYKVAGNRYKVGAGGARMDFETFNGNVYLKEKN